MAKIPGYYDVQDVAMLTGMSESWAQKNIKKLNQILEDSGQYILSGKIPKELFHDKFPYIKKAQTKNESA